MEAARRPTIKDMFVKSHIRALERDLGQAGITELERRFGRPILYGNGDDVPIADEVALLEHIVEMQSSEPLTHDEIELEAGRLHFRNFSATPLWKIIEPMFGWNHKRILMASTRISGYVFQDVQFSSEEMGESAVRIAMYNNDYPLAHFQGFLEEVLGHWRLDGRVDARIESIGCYVYTISWEPSAR